MDRIVPPGTRNPGFRFKLCAVLRMMKIAFVADIAQSAVLGCCSTPNVDNSVVPEFDLVRFLGKWHEIARFDHPFERGIEEAEATYSLLPDGKVQVVNSGRKRNKTKTANGIAKATGTPGLLRVTFFWPFYADPQGSVHAYSRYHGMHFPNGVNLDFIIYRETPVVYATILQ